MPNRKSSIVNISLVGGGGLCKELLEKTTFDYMQEGVDAPILAVADQDPSAPGMVRARELGLLTFQDYHDLYDPRYNIHLIVILTPEPHIFDDILATRPPRIRIMSHKVFEVFWNAIASEERKLRVQKTAMETILNGIQDFILVITPEMEITEVNESFLIQTGLTREEVIGRKCHDVYGQLNHVCDNLDLICPLEEVVRNKTHCRQVRSRKGSERHPSFRGECLSHLGKQRQNLKVHSHQSGYHPAVEGRRGNDPPLGENGRGEDPPASGIPCQAPAPG